jgi:uncharacterized protein
VQVLAVNCCSIAMIKRVDMLVLLLVCGLTGQYDASAGEGTVDIERLGLTPVQSLLEMRQDEVIIQRWDASCGAAALATLLTYQHGDPVSERDIAEAMLHRDEYLAKPSLVGASGGFSLLDMQRFVERRGYQGLGYAGLTLKDLIQAGPTIVPVLFDGFAHFVVFRGIYQNRVLLADPAYGNRTMPIADFEQAWQQHIGFMVRQPGGSVSTNELSAQRGDFLVPSAAAVRAAALP